MSTPAVIAHRGNSSVAPQNTLAALEAAWRAKAASIEIDIQVTADGDAAVIHDATVDATTDGKGRVAEKTMAELAQLDAGSWFSPAYAGQRVPSFADVLEFLQRRAGIDLLLEAKEAWPRDALVRVLASIDEAGLTDRITFQSFSVETMRLARELAPGLRRELLIGMPPSNLLTLAAELTVAGVNPPGLLIASDRSLVPKLHDAGLTVSTWTINKRKYWEGMTAAGVDSIITDRPDALHGWFKGRRKRD